MESREHSTPSHLALHTVQILQSSCVEVGVGVVSSELLIKLISNASW